MGISVLSEEEKEQIRKVYGPIGFAKGYAEGKAKEWARLIKILMQDMNLSVREAMRLLRVPEAEQKLVLEMMKQVG